MQSQRVPCDIQFEGRLRALTEVEGVRLLFALPKIEDLEELY
jgi:hypothetical protein